MVHAIADDIIDFEVHRIWVHALAPMYGDSVRLANQREHSIHEALESAFEY